MILELGGKCHKCGTTEDLSFDHISGKDRISHDVEWSYRISIMQREHKQKLIQLLCRPCNARKGDPRRAWGNAEDANRADTDDSVNQFPLPMHDADEPF